MRQKQHSTPSDVITIVLTLAVGMFLGYFAAVRANYQTDTPAIMMETGQ